MLGNAPALSSSAVIVDPGLPMLSAVLDRATLSAHLREHLPARLDPGDFEVRLLRHHAGKRCVLELVWGVDALAFGMVAKVYAKDRPDVYRVMDELRRAGLGPGAEFSIPQPRAYVPELKLLIQERVEGIHATEHLVSGNVAERGSAAERCAAWLAALHAVAPRTASRVDLDARLVSMERWVRRLAALRGPIAARALQLQRLLESAAAGLPDADACTLHGDYSHHQVLFVDQRTVVVDWDKHRVADPGDDVARFIVGLQRLAQRTRGAMRALDRTADAFLEAYLASATADCGPRVAFHRAAVCLEHAKHDVHKQSTGWLGRALASLREGLRVLGHGS